MDTFYGFDLGDAESAIAILNAGDDQTPRISEACGAKSFITACAATAGGSFLIGEPACYQADAITRSIRFKSRYLTDPSSAADVRRFAAGVLGSLYGNGDLIKGSDSIFYVGCPAGWDRHARERYREIFEQTGYPPLRIISESRAALISACQSKHLQVGVDILSRPVLVIDIGSSTTDYAYISGGQEKEMLTAGEVALGGGIMDELLLETCVQESEHADAIRAVFSQSSAWKNYCEFAARRLKERYYSDPDFWTTEDCTQSVLIRYDKPLRLVLRMNAKVADRLENRAAAQLCDRSFRQVFCDSLRDVRSQLDTQPELLFLTGGVSKLPSLRSWCEQIFPDAVVITGSEPEFAVARGLAWSGRIDQELKAFRADLRELIDAPTVEDLVRTHIHDLFTRTADAMVEPVIREAAVPVFERWRQGEIARLSDLDSELETAITSYLRTDRARTLMSRPVSAWMKPVAEALEEYTVPICIRHHVPYTALSLNPYLLPDDIRLQIDAKNVFAVDQITLLIDSIVTVCVSLLCGGSGIALISGGFSGIAAGAALSVMVLVLGKKRMEKTLLRADLPRPLRKLVPKDTLEKRMDTLASTARRSLRENMEDSRSEEITTRMVGDISAQIEQSLTRLAEIVEIPLG